ncbi:glycosyltransferase family 4 protein [Cutibacterium sp. WCA-380-WT-3A]|uniref:Glycosyltransferase family 4 protein n=1 Tax=Cutibacterium porci TaxID=2605781 RepID=A0A7K0J9P4_9ACTN|nr:glycosyltransferase [Cutibacterium porci]MSS46468.1 glycosyltransferase family 4 protein [Cutibacterium porci]
MRILLVVDTLRPGNGTTTSTLRFSHALRAQGHEVRLLSAVGTAKPHTDGIPVIEVPNLYVPVISSLADVQNVDLAQPVRAVIGSAVAHADVVHVIMPSPMGVCAKHVAGHAGVPVTAGFHIQPENITYNLHLARARRLSDDVYRILWRAFYHDVAHIHAPSEFIAQQLRIHGYRQHLHVISNGVPPQFRPGPLRQTWTLDSDGPATIMTVGRLSPEKRIDVLIDAVARARHRDRIRLVVAGRGPDYESLQRRAHRAGVHAVFVYHDRSEDLIAELRAADLYVHPADVEIESLAALEAASVGLPCLIVDSPLSATSQFCRVAEHGVCPPRDPQAMAAEIDWWLEHPLEREAAGKAQAHCRQEYALDRSARMLAAMFDAAVVEPVG